MTSLRQAGDYATHFEKWTGTEAQNLINVFLTANSLELFRQWVADGRRMPLEEVIGLTGILLDEGISSLLKRSP